jgi:hypothetical protein
MHDGLLEAPERGAIEHRLVGRGVDLASGADPDCVLDRREHRGDMPGSPLRARESGGREDRRRAEDRRMLRIAPRIVSAIDQLAQQGSWQVRKDGAAQRTPLPPEPDTLERAFARSVSWVRSFYGREVPADETLWHRWYVFFPVRCNDGWTVADVWRRRVGAQWTYKRHEESQDDWEAKIW